MNTIKYIVLLIIVGLLGFIAGYYYKDEPQTVVKEVKVYETKYKYLPASCGEAFECAQSQIKISVEDSTKRSELKENEIYIKAEDKCKQAEAIAVIDNKQKVNIVPYIAGGFITGILTILTIITVL